MTNILEGRAAMTAQIAVGEPMRVYTAGLLGARDEQIARYLEREADAVRDQENGKTRATDLLRMAQAIREAE